MTGSRQTIDATPLKPGDVLRYVGERTHCREWMAIVEDNGRVHDTYWLSDRHLLTDKELGTAEVLFNVSDYEALDQYSPASRTRWETYHPDDRGRYTKQGGHQEVLFIRTGAKPHLETQIANAEDAVARAEAALASASHRLGLRQQELAALREGR